MFDRRSEGEKRYDVLAAEAKATVGHMLKKDINNLSDEDKTALASAGIFGASLQVRCYDKALRLSDQRAQSTALKDRFMRAIDAGYLLPRPHERKIVREAKEELVADYDAYQKKLEWLRSHGATGERLAEEAQKLAEALKTAGTLAKDLKVGKPLKIQKKPRP